MDVFAWIVIGLLAGWIASVVMRSGHSVIEDIILGIIGALVGGFIMNSFGSAGVTGFNLYSFLVAILGSIVIIAIGRAIHRV